MKVYKVAFNAGETKDFIVDADFFRIMDNDGGASAFITVNFWGKAGTNQDQGASGVLAGYWTRIIGGFFRVSITSALAQNIQFAIGNGDGGYDRTVGTVSISGNTNANPFFTTDLITSYGASFRSVANLLANTPETVFTPAANVNGAIVYSAQFMDLNSTAFQLAAFLAKTSAPITVTDGDAILSTDLHNSGATWNTVTGSLKKPVKIAAGKGLYYISDVTQSKANRSVLYTLLP